MHPHSTLVRRYWPLTAGHPGSEVKTNSPFLRSRPHSQVPMGHIYTEGLVYLCRALNKRREVPVAL